MQKSNIFSTVVPKPISRFATAMDDSLVAMACYHDTLPGNLQTNYSQANYLAVVRVDTPMSVLRSAFNDSRILSAVISDDLLPFAAQVAPITYNQLVAADWWGEKPQVFSRPAPFEAEVAEMALQLLDASVLLASHELDNAASEQAETKLTYLVQMLGIDESLPLPLKLAACFATLEAMLDEADVPALTEYAHGGDEMMACLPGVRTIYEEIDSAIVVLESGESLLDVDWQLVEENFADSFGRIQFTTQRLLPFLVQYPMAVAFAIGRYRLHWGVSAIENLDIPSERLVLNAAKTVLEIYCCQLPHGFIQAHDEEALNKHIHDLQNEFLKVSFQYELLTLMCGIPRHPVPRLDIDRSIPFALRIASLWRHLRQWLLLYEQILVEVRSAESDAQPA